MASRFLVINGPNLNLLGTRNPGVYGSKTLAEIGGNIAARASDLGVEVDFSQSNSEGAIIDHLQANASQAQGIIINPGAFSHYSYALRDALAETGLPVVEVHITNIHAREEWRRRSVTAEAARGQIAGLGWKGYVLALEFLVGLVREESQ